MVTCSNLARLAVLAVWVAGCAGPSGPTLYGVSGQVTGPNRPFRGTITFLPLDGPGGPGTRTSAEIVAGHYHVPASIGLQPGIYRVRVVAEPPSSDIPDAHLGQANLPTLPAKYNDETILRAEVQANKGNVFDFDVN